MKTSLRAARSCCLLWVTLLMAAVPALAGPGGVHTTQAAKIKAFQDQERMHGRQRALAHPPKAEVKPSLWTRVTSGLAKAAVPPRPEPETMRAPLDRRRGGSAMGLGLASYLKPGLLLAILATNPLHLAEPVPAGGLPDPLWPEVHPAAPGWLDAAQESGLEAVFPNAVCPAASDETAGKPWPAVPIEVMGLGELADSEALQASRRVRFGLRVIAGPGSVNGWLTVGDRHSRRTFTGTVREIEVPARDGSGAPRMIHLSGPSDYHDGVTFRATVAAPSDAAGKARLSISVSGGPMAMDCALADLASGYLVINENDGVGELLQLGPPEGGGHP